MEVADAEGLEARLEQYFDLVRGEADADDHDNAREAYMAQWIRATLAGPRARCSSSAAASTPRPCGGLRSPATRRSRSFPEPPEDTEVGGFLVPYSFKRLDSFAGYQSGMPSPEYYQRLWEAGPEAAAETLVNRITNRLRDRGLHISTSDLIGARSLTEGLSRLRGHERPGRTDLLDGLASALISDDLEAPLPWTRRGSLTAGTHPVVVEMTAALTGERVGPCTPTPRARRSSPTPGRTGAARPRREGPVHLDLAKALDLERSRVLHCLRLLKVPGVRRDAGPPRART